jgi:hypothetical protein
MYRKLENQKIATTSWTFHILLFHCVLLGFLINGTALAIEEPKYEVALSQGEFELRRYAPHIIAATYIDGDFSNVGNEGFRRLAGYIFGGNRSRQQLSMTAPVTLNPQSEKIAMTAPVSQQSFGNQWRITFTMPTSYTIETLPIPNDSRVELQEVSEQLVATLRYSGSSNNASYQKRERMLLDWISDKGWIIESSPTFARYDAPYVPWFLRRNEILIEVTVD